LTLAIRLTSGFIPKEKKKTNKDKNRFNGFPTMLRSGL
jgi:hypothetical protein